MSEETDQGSKPEEVTPQKKPRRKKRCSPREQHYAKLLAETGMGSIEAGRIAFGWRCEPGSSESQKVRDLARSDRVVAEVERIRGAKVDETIIETTVATTDKVDITRIRDYAFAALEKIRDNPTAKAATRFQAIKILQRLHDPSKDINLIWRWIDIAWRSQTAHCPACHNDFPLAMVRNAQLKDWRSRHDAPDPQLNLPDLYSRRLELFKRADQRRLPHPDQVKALAAPERHIVGTAAARAGKVLAPHTPILTAKGWVEYKDLQFGDTLFDENGNTCNIVAFSPMCNTGRWYKITFDTGEEIVAHENHEWLTHSHNYRQALRNRNLNRKNSIARRKLEPTIVTTKEIKNTLYTKGKQTNYAIPINGPIKFDVQELLIDPYTLGVWLGDGAASGATIISADMEVIENISKAGYKVKKYKSLCEWGIGGLRSQLKEIQVLRHKHIPVNYLQSSINQRLALLQGLMDSDGSINQKGQCKFTNTNLNLVKGVKFLLRSLGIKVNDERREESWFNGKRCKDIYNLFFTTTCFVFRLTRKLDRLLKKVHPRVHYHYIRSVEEVTPEQGRCIEVDSKSHLYLAGTSLVPTHNSYLLALFVLQAFMLPGVEVWILSRTYEDARSEVEYLQRFLKTLFHPHADLLVSTLHDKKTGELTMVSKWGSELRVRSAKAKGSITGRALELAGVAEPGWLEADIYEELRARMSERLGRIIALGTPKGTAGLIGRLTKMTGRDPKTGKIIRRTAEDRLISHNCPWNTSMLVYRLDPQKNPEYVKSERDAARQELTDEEYASEFEGIGVDASGLKFAGVQERHLIRMPPSYFERSVFVLGIDQGPRNFGASLIAYDGQTICTVWEYFNGDETTMKRNLLTLRKEIPRWIMSLGGDPQNWKLTITDRDPLIDGIFLEIEEEGLPWATDIVLRHLNNTKMLDNWRRENQEFVNNMARRNLLLFHLSDIPAPTQDQSPGGYLLHDQMLNCSDVLEDPERESKSDSKKGWIVSDPWRGDHVLDSAYFAIWTICSGQLVMPERLAAPGENEDPWAEHKAAFNYQLKRDERREMTGGIHPDEARLFEEQFGRKPVRTFTNPGYYRDES